METQKIIITGGATRIGAAIAESLANDKNQITIHYNKSKKNAEQLKNILEKKENSILVEILSIFFVATNMKNMKNMDYLDM